MDQLIERQNTLLGMVERALPTFLRLNLETVTVEVTQGRLGLLEKNWSQCTDLDSRINATAAAEEVDKSLIPYFKENVFIKGEDKYFQAYDHFVQTIARLTPASMNVDPRSNTPHSLSRESFEPTIRLPAIELPLFSGNYLEWQQFHDIFSSIVDSRENLTKSQKLYYLKSRLTDEAAQLIKHFATTDANYDSAWETLKQRYENKRAIVSSLLHSFISIPTSANESVQDLKRIRDNTNESRLALANLNRPVQHWDDIIVFLVTMKLSKQTLAEWEKSLGDKREYPTYEELNSFLSTRIRSLEAIQMSRDVFNHTPKNSNDNKSQRLFTKVHHANSNATKCPLCSQNHVLAQCYQFKSQPVTRRQEIAREYRCCYNCLKPGHIPRNCNSKTCVQCKRRHHTLLHNEQFSSSAPALASNAPQSSEFSNRIEALDIGQKPNHSSNPTNLNSSNNYSKTQANHVSCQPTLLATAKVLVRARNGRELRLRAFLDQGSQSTFVSESVAQLLRAKRFPVMTEVSGMGDISLGMARSRVELLISPLDRKNDSVPISALVLSRLTSYSPPQFPCSSQWKHLKDLALADPQFLNNEPIDLIIGADYYGVFLLDGVRKGSVNAPIAQRTVFGWIISGPINSKPLAQTLTVTKAQPCFTLETLQSDLRLFWELEEIPEKPILTESEQACEDHFRSTHWRNVDGRYVVRLPFQESKQNSLGESLKFAAKMFDRIEKRLSQNPSLEEEYRAFLKEYEKLGHMREVSSVVETDPSSIPPVYLPHHPVVRESSTTTRVRVVFNASHPTSSGVSLNDTLLIGPKLQTDISSHILRWSQLRYVYTADISKMFRQILLDPRDVDFQRIVYRFEPSQDLKHFQLLTVTYGTASAPYLANRVLKQLAEDEGPKYPIGRAILERDFYVDDALFGGDTKEAALQARSELIQLLRSGGFTLSKWTSNDPSLLRDCEQPLMDQKVKLTQSDKASRAVLGLHWDPVPDNFRFYTQLEETSLITKRVVLSLISRLFDPLGWVTPVIVVAKLLIQELWLRKLDWDEPLPAELKDKWLSYYSDLPHIQDLRIQRWTGYESSKNVCELHGFADSSTKAYAAVVYLRILPSELSGKPQITLLMAKTKVAPISTISVPRLELCAAVLLSRLIIKVVRDLSLLNLPIYAWTDSTVVLAWLSRTPSTWPIFVANRVAEIQSRLPNAKWRHVPTFENPADCASRGLSSTELINHHLWWHGPSWLNETTVKWPSTETPHDGDLEKRTQTHAVISQPVETLTSRLSERVSSWPKLLRITAYCYRFINHAQRRSVSAVDKVIGYNEIQKAKNFWVKYLQREYFCAEIELLTKKGCLNKSSPLKSLSPFLDKDGILRVGGRLENAPISFEAKHPIILPNNRITNLITLQAHQRTLHGGSQLTLHVLRQNFWILGARNLVKKVIHQCVPCVREKAALSSQKMGDLPVSRVTPSKPFLHAGLDYAGPILVRLNKGRGHKSQKAYVALFICLATRAIHLELASDYSTDSFLAAFKRFVSRRGLPSDLYSDNGTNFQGADRELTNSFKRVSRDEDLQNFLTQEGVTWHFNPPSAPHFGGIWEAGVRSVKKHLRRMIGSHTLSYEELTTLLCQIEACLNSRPIAALSSDPDDFSYLTPGHFLVGSPLLAVPESSVLHLKENRLSRWQLVQRINEHFWRRWAVEYLQQQQHRYKWFNSKPNLAKGDLVLLRNPLNPPSTWLLGRIVSCHPGRDQRVRVVDVKTAHGVYRRPIVQLCQLPVQAQLV